MSGLGREVEELFHAASALPRGERREFVAARCGGRVALAAEVLALLATLDEPTTEFLASPVVAMVQAPGSGLACGVGGGEGVGVGTGAGEDAPPETIGPFRIIGLLGAGGMGRVYEAEQESPRRRVALKVIQPGLMSRSVLRRFEHEAQILAGLQHPGIAQVHQAGALAGPDGVSRPFFAMELVRGPNLGEYARQRGLTMREKLLLLARICDAVQHAHLRGVIHCDLKPGNILVCDGASAGGGSAQETPQPKVLDFGIARLVDEPEGQAGVTTVRAATSQVVGTLGYMAPEQLDGTAARLDTRCDIYALGVIGYELLSGRHPLELQGRPLVEAARVIRESEPARLGAVAPALRGDVETIIGKSMEKERERRYASAGELAEDLRRWLRDEPISARPASAIYQLSKFARRNKALVAGALATLLTLAAGTVVSTWLALSEAEQRVQARRSEEEARAEAARAGLAAAAAELRSGGGISGRARLEAIAPEARGWEWRYLRWLADRSRAGAKLGRIGKPLVEGSREAGWRGLITASVGGRCLSWGLGGEAPSADIELPAHRYGCSLSPDGSTVLVMPSAERIVAVDRATGRELWAMSAADAGERPFSADGSRVLVRMLDRAELSLLESRTGRRTAAMPSRYLGNLLSDGTVVVEEGGASVRRSFPDGAEVQRLPMLSVVFADGLARAAGVTRTDVAVVECPSGRLIAMIPDAGAHPWVLTRDGSLVIAASSSGVIRTYEASTGQPLASLLGHDGVVEALAATPDGGMLLSVDSAAEARSWDLRAGPSPFVVVDRGDRAGGADFSPDGAMVVRTGWGSAKFVDTLEGGERGLLVTPAPDEPASPVFSGGGDRVCIVGWASSVLVAETPRAPAGGLEGAVTGTGAQEWGAARVVWRKALPAVTVRACWSSDDERIFAACVDGVVRVLNSRTGAEEGQVRVGGAPLAQVAWDAARGRLIVLASDGAMQVLAGWPLARRGGTGSGSEGAAESADGRGPRDPVALAIDPSSGRVAVCGKDGEVVILEARRDAGVAGVGDRLFAEVARVRLPSTPGAAAFHPDGSRLAVGCDDGVVRLLDGRTLREILAFTTSGGRVLAVRLSDRALSAAGVAFALTAYEIGPGPEWAARRLLVERARRVIDPLFMTLRYSDHVAQAVEGDLSLDAGVRAAARALARGRGDHYNRLNSNAWQVGRSAGRSAADYVGALEDIERCCAAAPERGEFENTRGVVLLRLGRHEEAIKALMRSEELMRARWPEGHPIDAAALSLCLRALGNPGAADEWLERADRLMRDPQHREDGDSRAFLEEARAAAFMSR